MAKWGKCDFSGFEDFAKSFEKLDADALCRECSRALAARLLALVIPVTPVGAYPKRSGKKGGTLRRGWGATGSKDAVAYANSLQVSHSGDTYMIEIVNPVEYASYVEFGHRTVGGGWVEGRYMLTVSEEKLKRVAPSVLEKMLYQKLKEACDGRDRHERRS